MAYEAKNVSGVATSQEELTPWTNITDVSAKSECQNLGINYDLISNQEWMTIARDIESVHFNWSSGTVGSGCIYSGNIRARACSYDGANPEFGSGRNTLASLQLSNGNIIWDFSGNVWEFVDWTLGGSLGVPPNTCTGSWVELNTIACGALNYNDYMPSNSSLDSANEIGMFNEISTGSAILRGSGTGETNTLAGGIYDLRLNASNTTSTGVGFRCVYR